MEAVGTQRKDARREDRMPVTRMPMHAEGRFPFFPASRQHKHKRGWKR